MIPTEDKVASEEEPAGLDIGAWLLEHGKLPPKTETRIIRHVEHLEKILDKARFKHERLGWARYVNGRLPEPQYETKKRWLGLRKPLCIGVEKSTPFVNGKIYAVYSDDEVPNNTILPSFTLLIRNAGLRVMVVEDENKFRGKYIEYKIRYNRGYCAGNFATTANKVVKLLRKERDSPGYLRRLDAGKYGIKIHPVKK